MKLSSWRHGLLSMLCVLSILVLVVPLLSPAAALWARPGAAGRIGPASVALRPQVAAGLPFAPNWVVEGDQADAEFGGRAAPAGDVNGDGYDDVIVGAWNYDHGQADEGMVYLYYGSATGLSTTPAWTAEGDATNYRLGISAAGAGDVNGDGYDDLIVGVENYANGEDGEGGAYVYYGSPTVPSTTPDWIAESNQSYCLFGAWAASAGDVNGDTYDDIVVCAVGYQNGEGQEGAGFVWYGGSGGLGANGNPGNADWMGEGNQVWAQYCRSAGTAGDVNGDGYDDLVVGAWYYADDQSMEGRAYVYYGSASGLSSTANWMADGNLEYAQFGGAVGTAGDVNDDGYDDVAIGARLANGEGRISVYHGSATGLPATANWIVVGDQDASYFGSFGPFLGTAGDVNGDGYDDLIAGAHMYDQGQTDEGRVYVYHGSATGLGAGPAWTAEGNQASAQFGAAVATAGNVDGDGYDDVIIGAPSYPNAGGGEGKVFVYHGGPTPPPKTLILTNRQQMEASYGDASALMGKLYELAAHPQVVGKVVTVEDDPQVAAAYGAWNANPGDATANAVATAIRDRIITPTLAVSPTIEYVVIAGSDAIVPFYRLPDNTPLPNDPSIHTDDFYADLAPTPYSGHDLYIPDLFVGRLVEAPGHMILQIDTFLADNTAPLTNAIVVAYDFMQDSGLIQAAALASNSLTVDSTLIGSTWTRDQFLTQVLNTRHDAASLNQHADYDRLGTPVGTPNPLVLAGEFLASPDIHRRAIFWSPGCHSGQNVIGLQDWPEVMAYKRATYIANTGYGWGCTGGMCLSEILMRNVTEQLITGTQTTTGRALAEAKQRYLADHPNPGALDEKTVFESALYGLPMYQVTSPPPLTGQAVGDRAAQGQGMAAGDTLAAPSEITHTLEFTYTRETDGGGAYYVLDGWATQEDGEIVQPRLSYDVGTPSMPAHGVLFVSGTYTSTSPFVPVLQELLTTTAGVAPRSRTPDVGRAEADDWYPTLFHDFSRLDTAQATWEVLLATLGQYHAGRAEERLMTDADFVSLHSSIDDWEPPVISQVDAWLVGNRIRFEVAAADASGVHAVLATYTADDGAWRSIRLEPAGSGTWTGSLPAADELEFFVQAADLAGNVALRDDQGAYFRPVEGLIGLLAWNDGPTPLGAATTLTATVEVGAGVSYAWAFGDDTFGMGPVVEHVYPSADIYTAVVTASNQAGSLVTTTIVTVFEPTTYMHVYLPLVVRGGP